MGDTDRVLATPDIGIDDLNRASTLSRLFPNGAGGTQSLQTGRIFTGNVDASLRRKADTQIVVQQSTDHLASKNWSTSSLLENRCNSFL
jgi:hypothetical protein